MVSIFTNGDVKSCTGNELNHKYYFPWNRDQSDGHLAQRSGDCCSELRVSFTIGLLHTL
jgi:hypothetical protein